ncbi:MAG: threonine dehydratase [Acidobacteria bacterium]|nr:MAG: threonine dehydratase [Acidobacteriota bacterium]
MITLEKIQQAQERLRGIALRTPLQRVSFREGEVYLKPENLQPIGSFKLRGAYNKIATFSPGQRERGVIAYSSGNHAQGVAYAARAMGCHATIVMPDNSPQLKLEKTRALGAEIVIVGPSSDERKAHAEELAQQKGYALVPPYDDEAIIAGQGTMGLEILTDLPETTSVLVCVGGGGMISGIAAAVKNMRPSPKVYGVESELGAKAKASFEAGERLAFPAEETARTIADGLRTQSVGECNFEHIQRYVDGFISVSEDEIREAVRRLAFDAHLIAEPSGAVPLAAALFHRNEFPSSGKTVVIVSGGNIAPQMLQEILTEQSS